MKRPKSIHFVGIKGVGMAPLAVVAKEAGILVTGSDIADGFITDNMLQANNISIFETFEPQQVEGVDLVITTGAHGGYDNPEVVHAKKIGVPVLTQGQAVGEFMQGEILGKTKSVGVSVGGTHGKTTTSAMVATVLERSGLSPSWVIGTSEVKSLGVSGHFGKGDYFVAEADEYANEPKYDKTPKMLLQHPKIAIITNIEHDHPDLYETLNDVQSAFLQFANGLLPDGLLITCGDDAQVQQLLKSFQGKVKTYGFSKTNDYVLEHVTANTHGVSWTVSSKDSAANLSLGVSGEHNALNATATYIVGKTCGLTDDQIVNALKQFAGTKRRMEYVGQLSTGALLYDDYAHHPTEIEKTLTALKEKYPEKKLICIFQPHTYSRTKLLFDQFVDSLALADEVVLSDIYSSAREAYDPNISSSMLVDKIRFKKPAVLAKMLPDVVKYINQHHFGEDTIVLTMGAGDIYKIADQILEHT